jgi:hypothetical protein
MGWLGRLLSSVSTEVSEDLTFVDSLAGADSRVSVPLVADKCYLELYVDSLRIEKARAFATRFHGVVYCYVTLARFAESNSVIAAVTKPTRLADLDSGSVGKVITLSRKMMGAVPWRGGSLAVELGLFSVKSGNLLSPTINFVTRISDLAGISFVDAAKPFVPLLTEGMDLIAGQTSDVRLEVGVDTDLEVRGPLTCAIIAAPRGSVDRSALSLDPVDRKLLYHGEPMQAGYCIFSIRATDRKADFGEIPALKEAFAAFQKSVLGGRAGVAREALASFRRAVVLSPDLISADAERLVRRAEEMMARAFAPTGMVFGGAEAAPTAVHPLPMTLSDLDLYGP